MYKNISVTAVVATSGTGVIARNGKLPWHLPPDLRRLKRLTLKRPLIMGRKTWDADGQKGFTQRATIVMSRSPCDVVYLKDGFWAENVDEALKLAADWIDAQPHPAREIIIFGGGEIYARFMPYIDKVEKTIVDVREDIYDTAGVVRFPPLPEDLWTQVNSPNWVSGKGKYPNYKYVTYKRKKGPHHDRSDQPSEGN